MMRIERGEDFRQLRSAFVRRLAFAILIVSPVLAAFHRSDLRLRGPDDRRDSLKKIYDEVKEVGVRPSEDFIKAEVFIGKEDDDDTNKDIHVLVLIQNTEGIERMKVQVTYMERTKEDPRIKNAKETRSFVCRVDGNVLRIESSAYKDKEIGPLADEILKAVKNKKRLMKGR